MKPLKVAVIGVGHLGKEHARIYHTLPGVNLVAVVDTNPQRTQAIAQQYHTSFCLSHKALFNQRLDAVSIVTPTITHYAIGREFIKRGIHTFIEKPITTNLTEAKMLVQWAKRYQVVLQIGHIERFNPALRAVWPEIKHPRFIECHRLSGFTARSLDIDVILDLMIHDLDIVLALTNSPLKEIKTSGVKVLSNKIDLANARLAFRNGCVANLTASRISDKSMRKLRVFTPEAYFSVDFLEPLATIYRRRQTRDTLKTIPGLPRLRAVTPKAFGVQARPLRSLALTLNKPLLKREALQKLMTQQFYEVQRPKLNRAEPLCSELSSFIDCIKTGQKPVVTGEDGLRALEVAHQILKKL